MPLIVAYTAECAQRATPAAPTHWRTRTCKTVGAHRSKNQRRPKHDPPTPTPTQHGARNETGCAARPHNVRAGYQSQANQMDCANTLSRRLPPSVLPTPAFKMQAPNEFG